jgi:hypothetical protein
MTRTGGRPSCRSFSSSSSHISRPAPSPRACQVRIRGYVLPSHRQPCRRTCLRPRRALREHVRRRRLAGDGRARRQPAIHNTIPVGWGALLSCFSLLHAPAAAVCAVGKKCRHPGRHELRAAAAVQPRTVLAHRLLVDVAPHDLRLDGLPLCHACAFCASVCASRGARLATNTSQPVRRAAAACPCPAQGEQERTGKGALLQICLAHSPLSVRYLH